MLQTPGDRYHQRWLRNMYGAFLTLLDEEGRILYFAGGALRRRATQDTDEVTILTPEDIMKGVAGGYQPDYRQITLEGEMRREYKVVFRDIPFLSAYLGQSIPTASSWAILKIGPSPDKRWNGAVPNGENSEVHLDNRTWNEAAGLGKVGGSGGNDISARLAPEASTIAESLQSAWSLAITGSFLFGGMSQNIPEVEPIKYSHVLNNIIDHETALRRQKKKEMDQRAAMRIASRKGEDPGAGMRALANAVNPAVLDEMAAKLQPDTGESGVGA